MTIPSRDSLPEDAADWNTIEVDFPRLERDTMESCPLDLEELVDYVRKESADLGICRT